MGDDVNDLPAMELAGLAAAPANAHASARAATRGSPARGGAGRCANLIDLILARDRVAPSPPDAADHEAFRLRDPVRRRPGRQARVHASRRRRHAPQRFTRALHRTPIRLQSPRASLRDCGRGLRQGRRTTWAWRMVTTGPGGTNAVTGVAGAWLDSTPCLFISGQVKRADLKGDDGLRQLGVQEIDIVSIVRRSPIRRHGDRPDVDPLSPGEGRVTWRDPAARDRSGSTFPWTCRPRRLTRHELPRPSTRSAKRESRYDVSRSAQGGAGHRAARRSRTADAAGGQWHPHRRAGHVSSSRSIAGISPS